jgi:hypothetical protein
MVVVIYAEGVALQSPASVLFVNGWEEEYGFLFSIQEW